MLKGLLKKKDPTIWTCDSIYLLKKAGKQQTSLCWPVLMWRGYPASFSAAGWAGVLCEISFLFQGKITQTETCAQPSLKSSSRPQCPGRRKGRWLCQSAAGKHTLMESQTWAFCISKMSRKQPKSEQREPGEWDKLPLQTQNTAAYSFILWGLTALTE